MLDAVINKPLSLQMCVCVYVCNTHTMNPLELVAVSVPDDLLVHSLTFWYKQEGVLSHSN